MSAHSRATMTTRRATIVPSWRTAMTRTPEESRASRATSVSIRDMRSAEWTSEKNASGMDWMCV